MRKEYWSDGMDHFTRVGKFYFLTKEQMVAARDSALASGGNSLFVSTVPRPG